MTGELPFNEFLDKGSFEEIYSHLHSNIDYNSIDNVFLLIESLIFMKKVVEARKYFYKINFDSLSPKQLKNYHYLHIFILHANDDFEAAIKKANYVLKEFNLTLREKIIVTVEKSFCLRKLSDFSEALICLEPFKNEIKSLHEYYIAYFYNSIGLIYWNKGDISQALNYFDLSLDLYRKINNLGGLAKLYNNKANVYNDMGNLDEALENYTSYLEIQLQLDNAFDIAIAYNNIAVIKQKKGSLTEAIEYYTRSLKIMSEIGNKTYQAVLHANIGNLKSDQGEFKEALNHLVLARDIFFQLNQSKHLAMTLNVISEVYFGLGDFEKGREIIIESINIKKNLNNDLDLIISIYTFFWYSFSSSKKFDQKIVDLFESMENLETESKNIKNYIDLIHSIIALEKGEYKKAKSLIIKIKDQEGIEFNHKIIALKSLLITELELWKKDISEENYSDFNEILNELLELSDKENLLTTYCEILVIEARFENTLLLFENGLETLNKGLNISIQLNMSNYINYFKKEIQFQEERIGTVGSLLKTQISEIDLDDLKKYILFIQQIIKSN